MSSSSLDLILNHSHIGEIVWFGVVKKLQVEYFRLVLVISGIELADDPVVFF